VKLACLQRQFAEELRNDAQSEFTRGFGPGFNIYRNNYRVQLHAALKDTFRHVLLWLGESEFTRVADVHIDRSPPASWTLDNYGKHFPAILRYIFPNDPEVWELAWLDLAMAEAFVASDRAPISPDDLMGVDWDQAQITFVPSLRFAEATSNAADIWSALDEDTLPPPASIFSERRGYLVWRRELTSCFRLVSIYEYQLITALHLKLGFGDACQILQREFGEEIATKVAGEALGRWLHDELIASITARRHYQTV
jgi:Putative DNA-binding domain